MDLTAARTNAIKLVYSGVDERNTKRGVGKISKVLAFQKWILPGEPKPRQLEWAATVYIQAELNGMEGIRTSGGLALLMAANHEAMNHTSYSDIESGGTHSAAKCMELVACSFTIPVFWMHTDERRGV